MSRETFLQRVRDAVREGNQAGSIPGLPTRGTVGYQGAGSDPIARLRTELQAAGARLHVVAAEQQAVALLLDLLRESNARSVVLGGGTLDRLDLSRACHQAGITVVGHDRDSFFAADVGITGVDALIAETGTVVLATRPDQPRSASLLPPIHLAVAWRQEILADLFDLFDGPLTHPMPACLSLITGPSKTGDIELKLVTGVHGPGEVHVIVIG